MKFPSWLELGADKLHGKKVLIPIYPSMLQMKTSSKLNYVLT